MRGQYEDQARTPPNGSMAFSEQQNMLNREGNVSSRDYDTDNAPCPIP